MSGSIIRYPEHLPSYGKWKISENGDIEFSRHGMDSYHPHKKISELFANVKNVQNIKMHKYSLMHAENGGYKINGLNLKHGNTHGLSEQIQKHIEPTLKIETKHGMLGDIFQEVHSDLTGIKAKIILANNVQFMVLVDANDHPVAATIFNDDTFSLNKISRYMAEYLSHEHHRASIAIHGDHKLCHAPDHIPPFQSPLEYWPNNKMEIFFTTPLVLNKFRNKP